MSNEHFIVNTVKNFAKIKSDQNILQVKKPNKICLLPNNEIAKKSISKANEFKKLSKISNDIPILHKFELPDLSVQRPKKKFIMPNIPKTIALIRFHKKFCKNLIVLPPLSACKGALMTMNLKNMNLKQTHPGGVRVFKKLRKSLKVYKKRYTAKQPMPKTHHIYIVAKKVMC